MKKSIWSAMSRKFKPRNEALADAYAIHGDGVARMIPEKLAKREKFRTNLAKLDKIQVARTGNKGR